MNPDRLPPLELHELYDPFAGTLPEHRVVDPELVPEPYRSLLDHDDHMTVTLEEHHGGPVRLEVLETVHSEPIYSRKILLRRAGDGHVVQFGIMRFDFRHCDREVRAEILAQRTPLGRILIEHDVMRHVDRHALVEIEPDAELTSAFGLDGSPGALWGRLATLFCDGRPAVALLEVIGPAR